jgi:hypothetical protein
MRMGAYNTDMTRITVLSCVFGLSLTAVVGAQWGAGWTIPAGAEKETDLTDAFRADLNPDGVMFHRVANGKPPTMPAFKSQLTAQEIWTVVAYAKSLRAAK